MTPRSNSQRWQIAAGLAVAAISLVNLVAVARRVPPPPVPVPGVERDPATEQEARLAPVRRELAARNIRGPVGYVADVPANRITADALATRDYYLAQFALVPVVLDLDAAAHAWAVANLRANPSTLPAGWTVEKDFGAGIHLLRKEAR